jgi:transposase
MRHLQLPLAYSNERIAAVTATDERVRRLQSVPNIGPVTAAAFVAAIDEASRLRRPHEVEVYLGLVPRELSSGRRSAEAGSPKRA